MRLRRSFLSFWQRKQNHGGYLNQGDYDIREINDRVFLATVKTGHTRADLAELFGMDASVPLYLQPPEKIPKLTLDSIARVSNYLGVSVIWLLHGKIENEMDHFVSSTTQNNGVYNLNADVRGPAVVQKNENCSSIIVKNIQGEFLTAQEREFLAAFRSLKVTDQAAVISHIFALRT